MPAAALTLLSAELTASDLMSLDSMIRNTSPEFNRTQLRRRPQPPAGVRYR